MKSQRGDRKFRRELVLAHAKLLGIRSVRGKLVGPGTREIVVSRELASVFYRELTPLRWKLWRKTPIRMLWWHYIGWKKYALYDGKKTEEGWDRMDKDTGFGGLE